MYSVIDKLFFCIRKMLNYKGVVCVFVVSVCCIPFTWFLLSHKVMSQLLPMYAVGYGILLTVLSIFFCVMPPQKNFWKFEKRGLFYYVCCILACVNVVQLSIQYRRFSKGGVFKLSGFFSTDEFYLKTPFGMSSILWNNGVCYFLYLIMIFSIDNCSNIRNLAVYWSGGMMTSEFVIGVSLLSGPASNKLQYSSVVDVFYICVVIWVLHYYLLINPRTYKYGRECRPGKTFDSCLAIAFILCSLFTFMRCLAVLKSSQYHIKMYRSRFEPYLAHKSNFGSVWILFTGAYGIPCQFLAIYYIYHCKCRCVLDISLLYAGSMLQGTVVYLSYNLYPSSEKAYRFPCSHIAAVMASNFGLVAVAHLFLFRCLWSYNVKQICSYPCNTGNYCCEPDPMCYDDLCGSLECDSYMPPTSPICNDRTCSCRPRRKRFLPSC